MADPRLGSINLNLLTALDALLTEVNVTRAAARAGVTQSAMSHSLRQLREIFEDPLLVRGPNGMMPTARAKELTDPIRRGLIELGRALSAEPTFDPSRTKRVFTLGAGDFFATLLLPPLLDILRREAPGVDLHVRAAEPRRETDRLDSGELDAAVVVALPARASLRSKTLFSESFACVVREDHPEVGDSLPLDLYVRLPHALISPRGAGSTYVDDALAAIGKARRIAVRVPYFLVAPMIVARSDLVLTAPRRIVADFARLLPLKVLEPPLELATFSVALAWHERDDADPGHVWMRDAISRAIAAADGEAEAKTRAARQGARRKTG